MRVDATLYSLLLQPSDAVELMSEALKATWEKELARAEAEKIAAKPGDKKKPRPPSLRRALMPLGLPLWRRAFAFFMFSICLSFLGPLLLTFTIALIENTQLCGLAEQAIEVDASVLTRAVDPPSISEACRIDNKLHLGYAYAAAMLVAKMVEAICQSWHTHLMIRVALRIRAAVISAIYRKCLWLSGMGTSDTTTGRIQNLMASDAQFFLQFAPQMNNAFAAPIQIIVAFSWLGATVGASFLAGMGVILISVPMQGMIIAKYFKCQVLRLKLTDERVKLCNEMVQGMRVIKM